MPADKCLSGETVMRSDEADNFVSMRIMPRHLLRYYFMSTHRENNLLKQPMNVWIENVTHTTISPTHFEVNSNMYWETQNILIKCFYWKKYEDNWSRACMYFFFFLHFLIRKKKHTKDKKGRTINTKCYCFMWI